MSSTKVFEATLKSGVKYEIHESQGFGDRCEVAIIVAGEAVAVASINVKRSGAIECKPSHLAAIKIRPMKEEAPKKETPAAPTVDDIAPGKK